MSKLLIFSGTSDGRILAEKLAASGHEVTVCVATEYGEQVMPDNPKIKVHCGRMDEAHMHSFMSSCGMDAVIDATHPYAKAVSENIRRVCNMRKYIYYRLIRDSFCEEIETEDIVSVENALEAARKIDDMEGNIFLSTGSKELPVFIKNIKKRERLFVRVLPSSSVLNEIDRAGLKGNQIICMQGPFSEELNYEMFIHTDAKILVTKESGSAGGFMEKINAAKRAGMKIIVIERPKEKGVGADYILKKFSAKSVVVKGNKNKKDCEKNSLHKKISLVGIGMGSTDNMTGEAYKVCREADLLIGAERMLSTFPDKTELRKISLFQPEKIADAIDEAQEKKIAVLLSGDVGFYSGAKKLIRELERRGYKDTEIFPGISTVVYLSAKAKISWEDMAFVSVHGRNQNVLDKIKYNKKVFVLVGGKDGVAELCKLLVDNNYSDIKVVIGSNLSYEKEKIVRGAAKDFCNYTEEGVSAVILINENITLRNTTHGIPDKLFIRDKVPMTKEEVRTVSLSKLQLKEDSVVYDIGSGSGSVAVECALRAVEGTVYAIEKKKDAVELIRKNCKKFAVSNVEIIEASAPNINDDIDKKMLKPTHAFIGGSGGKLSEILDWLKGKNLCVRVVINAIALETLSEIMQELKRRNIENPEIVSLSVAKSKKVGAYNMMMGNNPVYVVSFIMSE